MLSEICIVGFLSSLLTVAAVNNLPFQKNGHIFLTDDAHKLVLEGRLDELGSEKLKRAVLADPVLAAKIPAEVRTAEENIDRERSQLANRVKRTAEDHLDRVKLQLAHRVKRSQDRGIKNSHIEFKSGDTFALSGGQLGKRSYRMVHEADPWEVQKTHNQPDSPGGRHGGTRDLPELQSDQRAQPGSLNRAKRSWNPASRFSRQRSRDTHKDGGGGRQNIHRLFGNRASEAEQAANSLDSYNRYAAKDVYAAPEGGEVYNHAGNRDVGAQNQGEYQRRDSLQDMIDSYKQRMQSGSLQEAALHGSDMRDERDEGISETRKALLKLQRGKSSNHNVQNKKSKKKRTSVKECDEPTVTTSAVRIEKKDKSCTCGHICSVKDPRRFEVLDHTMFCSSYHCQGTWMNPE